MNSDNEIPIYMADSCGDRPLVGFLLRKILVPGVKGNPSWTALELQTTEVTKAVQNGEVVLLPIGSKVRIPVLPELVEMAEDQENEKREVRITLLERIALGAKRTRQVFSIEASSAIPKILARIEFALRSFKHPAPHAWLEGYVAGMADANRLCTELSKIEGGCPCSNNCCTAPEIGPKGCDGECCPDGTCERWAWWLECDSCGAECGCNV